MLDNVIIIPYRAREKHLKYYLENTVPLLQKHIPNGKVVIIEQDWNNKLFNRGCVLNIGINEYKNKTKFFISNDVDHNPDDDTIKHFYLNENYDALAIQVGHNNSFGGVSKFSHDSIFQINGFPNFIWGWGLEDRALYYRYLIMKKNISHKLMNKGKFKVLPHKHQGTNCHPNYHMLSEFEIAILNSKDYNKQYNHIMSSGLNNLQYKILERKNINDYVKLIKVSI